MECWAFASIASEGEIIMNKPTSQTASARWLTPMETLRMADSQAKSPFALIDKTSRHYDPIFPRPTKRKWRESDIQKYLTSRSTEGEK